MSFRRTEENMITNDDFYFDPQVPVKHDDGSNSQE